METKKLKVGDRIYAISYSSISQVLTIERVTATQAIAKDGLYKFKIEVGNYDYVSKIGRDRYSGTAFRLETPELKKEFWRQTTVYKLSKTNFDKLSDETLEKLLEVLESVTQKNNK